MVALEPSVWVWTAGRTTRAQRSRDPKWLAGGSTMTEGSGAKGNPRPFTDEARALGIDLDHPDTLAWLGEHLPEFAPTLTG